MAGNVIKVTIKKGDMLDKIAKKHGLKSGQFIFDAKENAKVKKLRGKPESIQPGDVFIIPAPDEKTIKNTFSKNMPRMSIDISGPKQLIFVQQKWEYTYANQAGTSNWTSKEKMDFHNNVDKAIWRHWSGKFTISVSGASEFAKVYKDTIFKVSFDIKYVKSGGHWKVAVTKIPTGSKKTSSVNWGNQTIKLDTEDTVLRVRDRDGKKFKQIPAAHEFGHAVGNATGNANVDHTDEYKVTSTYKDEKNSMMNVGMQLKKRHADHLIAELNKMVKDTVFAIKSVS